MTGLPEEPESWYDQMLFNSMAKAQFSMNDAEVILLAGPPPGKSWGQWHRVPHEWRSRGRDGKVFDVREGFTWRRYAGARIAKKHPNGDDNGFVYATDTDVANWRLKEEFGEKSISLTS